MVDYEYSLKTDIPISFCLLGSQCPGGEQSRVCCELHQIILIICSNITIF